MCVGLEKKANWGPLAFRDFYYFGLQTTNWQLHVTFFLFGDPVNLFKIAKTVQSCCTPCTNVSLPLTLYLSVSHSPMLTDWTFINCPTHAFFPIPLSCLGYHIIFNQLHLLTFFWDASIYFFPFLPFFSLHNFEKYTKYLKKKTLKLDFDCWVSS